jgi:hypothetical protein
MPHSSLGSGRSMLVLAVRPGIEEEQARQANTSQQGTPSQGRLQVGPLAFTPPPQNWKKASAGWVASHQS